MSIKYTVLGRSRWPENVFSRLAGLCLTRSITCETRSAALCGKKPSSCCRITYTTSSYRLQSRMPVSLPSGSPTSTNSHVQYLNIKICNVHSVRKIQLDDSSRWLLHCHTPIRTIRRLFCNGAIKQFNACNFIRFQIGLWEFVNQRCYDWIKKVSTLCAINI